MRLTCCLTVFLLMALLSNVHFHQAAELEAFVSTRKGVFNNGESSLVAFAVDKRFLGEMKLTVVKQETAASVSSGRREKKRKKKKKVVDAHARWKKSNGGKIPETADNKKEFVAFTADYGAPRHHPPKNN